MGTLIQTLGCLLAVLLIVIPQAQATVDIALQMQLGNPSNATADTNNHDHYLIKRAVEAMDYSDDLGQPNWASWDLTAADLGSVPRSEKFFVDTNLPANFYWVSTTEYSGSGYDRGHLCPSADRTDTTNDNDAVFYMSNIVPQAPDNNEGVWENFESYCRALVLPPNNSELLIIAGPGGFAGSHINASGYVAVPGFTWKIVVVVPLGSGTALSRITETNRVIAIEVPNTNGVGNAWQDFVTSVNQIQADTGYMFFTSLPSALATPLRAQVDGSGVILGWDMSSLSGGLNNYGPSPLGATTNEPSLAIQGLTRGSGVGVTGTAAAGGWGGTGFTSTSAAAAVAASQFVSFVVTPATGFNMSFKSINRLDYRRSDTGPPNGVIQYRISSGPFTDITNITYATSSSSGGSIQPIDLSQTVALQNVATNVTFRIVNYGGTSSRGTWYLYDVGGSSGSDFSFQGVVATNVTGFVAAWLAAHFPSIPPSQRGLSDTPFGDGIPNLVKYAFDVDFQHPTDEGQQMRLSTVTENGSTYASLAFKRRRISGLKYIPEVSSDLHTWYSDVNHVQIVEVMSLDADFDSVVIQDVAPVTPNNARFGRVRLVVTEN